MNIIMTDYYKEDEVTNYREKIYEFFYNIFPQ